MSVKDLRHRYSQGPDRSATKRGWAVHHTVTPESYTSPVEEIAHLDFIDTWHREKRGFKVGIAYHVVVFESGRAYQVGQPMTQRAHIESQNHLYDGLCFVGTFTATHTPSQAALTTARELIVASGMDVQGGHGELQLPGLSGTACPGGWNLGLLHTRPPAKPPFATAKTRNALALAIWLRKTPVVPHDVQVQDGKMYDRWIVRLPR
ncbi:MAG TPA: hypothetical protein VMX11_07125 [Actinomycetes bacterium]|nr:hypothetical protein [Actinomycetes bacterium]